MDDDANPTFFIPKEDQVGQAGKWNSLPKYLGYSTDKRNRSNDGKRRAVLEKLFTMVFTTDDEDVTKEYLEGWHEPKSQQRMMRILGNFSIRTKMQVSGGAGDRRDGKRWSYDSVQTIFRDAEWLMRKFGDEFPIIIYGFQVDEDDPILTLQGVLLEWTCCEDMGCKMNEDPWDRKPMIFNDEQEPECGECGSPFFNDTRYRSHQDLWLRRYNVKQKYSTEIVDLVSKSDMLDKIYGHVMQQRAEMRKRGEDQIGAIRADCEEMMGVAGDRIKQHGIDTFDPDKHLWDNDESVE